MMTTETGNEPHRQPLRNDEVNVPIVAVTQSVSQPTSFSCLLTDGLQMCGNVKTDVRFGFLLFAEVGYLVAQFYFCRVNTSLPAFFQLKPRHHHTIAVVSRGAAAY